MHAHISNPGVTLMVNLKSMRHVEQTGAEARLDFSFVSIKNEDGVFLYNFLLIQNILLVKAGSIPNNWSSLEDNRIIIKIDINSRYLTKFKIVIPAMNFNRVSLIINKFIITRIFAQMFLT